MTRTHKRRIWLIMAIVCGTAMIIGLVLFALRQNINLFYTPSELNKLTVKPTSRIRVGGMVRNGSLKSHGNLKVIFIITDYSQDLEIAYTGVLPDLFKEGQGVVAFGTLNANNTFAAEQILAKHDENYMPPELAGKIIPKESNVT